VWSTIVLLCLDNCCMLLLAGPAVFQCLYDDDDVETFFIFFYFFSSIFSLTSTAILVFHRMCSEEIISIRRFKMTAQRLLMVQF
jgi:hypothetical protein